VEFNIALYFFVFRVWSHFRNGLYVSYGDQLLSHSAFLVKTFFELLEFVFVEDFNFRDVLV
jgi:hypothetical protein